MEFNLNKSKKAGKIVAEAREYGKSLIKEGKKYIDVADAVEKKIFELGARPAFPCNISVNDIAAHHVPAFGETAAFKSGDLVKLDVGAHIDGHVVDTAITISIGDNAENKNLIKAAASALDAAIELAKPGVSVSKIGKVVGETIESLGLRPIRNLSGHLVELYNLHAGISIPNFDNKSAVKLEDGMVIAIEPFASTGNGYVVEGSEREIFMLEKIGNIRTGREILEHIATEFNTLPFAKRWLVKEFGALKVNLALKEMLAKGILRDYPVLDEKKGSKVAQAEHTILVAEKPLVLTKL